VYRSRKWPESPQKDHTYPHRWSSDLNKLIHTHHLEYYRKYKETK
jgi:hypothetical protein